jgi:hypothetical protein
MAIQGERVGETGGEQGLGVDAGATAGAGALTGGGGQETSLEAGATSLLAPTAKVLKPLPHGYYDYASAAMLMAAPWLFGFSRNRRATTNAVISGLGVLGLSLFTKYPLGAVKSIPFPVHGVIEAAAGALTATAPWLLGFSRNRNATLTHVLSGLGTLAVVAMTDYQAAEDGGDGARLGPGGDERALS